MNAVRRCPALLIAAPASGQGKTTVTAALARHYANRGLRVRVFKCGPDFLDPMILARACGAAVDSLDLWLVGEEECRRRLWQAAGEADLILVEGVMGLFDGTPSAADLARRFGVPVLAVIDGSAMAQTFAAIAHGLASFQSDLPFAGVLANRVGSARHGEILQDSLPAHLPWYGALPRTAAIELPSRHLGLVQAAELADLDARLDAAAAALAQSPEGAARVQDFHRQLFSSSADALREEIKRITGVEVREATAEVETTTGTVVQVFTTGTMVQVFLLARAVPAGSWSGNGNGSGKPAQETGVLPC